MGYSPWGHKESDMAEQLKQQHTNPTLLVYLPPPLVSINLLSISVSMFLFVNELICILLEI